MRLNRRPNTVINAIDNVEAIITSPSEMPPNLKISPGINLDPSRMPYIQGVEDAPLSDMEKRQIFSFNAEQIFRKS